MNKRILFFIFLFFNFNLYAQRFISKTGQVSFFSEAPMEDIKAINNKLGAVYDSKTGQLVFQLNIKDFVFPKALMQEHFNENYLESDRYPKSIFSGTVITQEMNKVTVEGDLSIHGKTNRIKVCGILKENKRVVNISAKFMVKLEDYDINIPKIVMYKIAEEVEVKIDIQLKKFVK